MHKEAGAVLATLARGLFLLTVGAIIAAYAISMATSSPPPMAPGDYVVQWC